MEEIKAEVLVIGGGGAAARAAVEAAKYGVSVILVDKGMFGRSGSTPIGSTGFSVPLGISDPRDNPKQHFQDVIKTGEYLNEEHLVKVASEEAIQRFEELVEMGAQFDKTQDGKYKQHRNMGMTYPRNVRFDYSQTDLMTILRKTAIHRGVKVFERIMLTDILKEGDRVCGAVGLSHKGELYLFKSKVVVLASGSATKLYPNRSSSFPTTGDSTYLTLKAGAKLIDMEFVEFTLVPEINGKVISTGGLGGLVASGSRYLNVFGERFMEKYDPLYKEATKRSTVIKAVYKEIKDGRGPISVEPSEEYRQRGGGHITADKRKAAAGINPNKDSYNLTIAVHRLLGGARINENAETDIKGLFAAGEASGGFHGAGRIAGNAILEILAMGARAGKFAALYALKSKEPKFLDTQVKDKEMRIKNFSENKGNVAVEDLEGRIRRIMDKKVGPLRNKKDLEGAINEITMLRKDAFSFVSSDNPMKILETYNLALTGEVIARSALMREESRGAHQREDFPEQDENKWIKHIEISLEGDEIKLSTCPVTKIDNR